MTRFVIRDEGQGIPNHELEAIESDEESPLEHGSGLGLWIAKWGTRTLGGELSFETTTTGTAVFLDLPVEEISTASD